MLTEAGRARRRLSLDEVLAAGLPALYERYGDRRLYWGGTIFDASNQRALTEIPLIVAGTAIQAVGVEFGWRHGGGCSCRFCSRQTADEAA